MGSVPARPAGLPAFTAAHWLRASAAWSSKADKGRCHSLRERVRLLRFSLYVSVVSEYHLRRPVQGARPRPRLPTDEGGQCDPGFDKYCMALRTLAHVHQAASHAHTWSAGSAPPSPSSCCSKELVLTRETVRQARRTKRTPRCSRSRATFSDKTCLPSMGGHFLCGPYFSQAGKVEQVLFVTRGTPSVGRRVSQPSPHLRTAQALAGLPASSH